MSSDLDRARLLTAEELAEMLGVAPKWVYRRAQAGEIPTVRLGRYYRFRPESIEAWIERCEQGSSLG